MEDLPVQYVEYHSQAWMDLFNLKHRTSLGELYGWTTWEVFEIAGGLKLAKMIYSKL